MEWGYQEQLLNKTEEEDYIYIILENSTTWDYRKYDETKKAENRHVYT